MLIAKYHSHTLNFNFPGGTSRGVLTKKPTWVLKLWDDNKPETVGVGEVSIIPNLSVERIEDVEHVLDQICESPQNYIHQSDQLLSQFPAVKFALETASIDLNSGGTKVLFPSDFTSDKEGIRINGLIWMGNKDEMLSRIKDKVEAGFSCLKLKVGAIDFDAELALLKYIRKSFSSETLELRVDANGAFSPEDALLKMEAIASYGVHSIEQPIKQGQWGAMANLCSRTPLPIALDEELIGVVGAKNRIKLLDAINPQYIILKPSLIGGLADSMQWSNLAQEREIGWWVTSALEGNIGLNAIAQWTFLHGSNMPQGLGTGQVFSNNFTAPLYIKGEKLYHSKTTSWKI